MGQQAGCAVLAEEQRFHMRAGGQHGDDHLGAFHGILCADGSCSPFGHDFGNGLSGQVKGAHVVSGLGEVDGHGRTHIA